MSTETEQPPGKARRILAGLATVIALLLAAEVIAPASTSPGRFLASTSISVLVAFIAGGYVARSSFILPALLFAAIVWTGAIYNAWRIAAFMRGPDLADLAIADLPLLVLWTLAAIAGAAVGMWLYAFRSSLWLLDH